MVIQNITILPITCKGLRNSLHMLRIYKKQNNSLSNLENKILFFKWSKNYYRRKLVQEKENLIWFSSRRFVQLVPCLKKLSSPRSYWNSLVIISIKLRLILLNTSTSFFSTFFIKWRIFTAKMYSTMIEASLGKYSAMTESLMEN